MEKSGRRFGKTELMILTIIIIVVIGLGVIWKVVFSTPGKSFNIMVNNQSIMKGHLSNECVIGINATSCIVLSNDNFDNYTHEVLAEDSTEITKRGITNVVVIRDGAVDVVWADCPDKICVNMSTISNVGESIVCMPNGVVVTVE